MAIAATCNVRPHHVHIGTSAVHNTLFKVLHHAQLNLFKRHALDQLFSGLACQQAVQLKLLRNRLSQGVVAAKLRNV